MRRLSRTLGAMLLALGLVGLSGERVAAQCWQCLEGWPGYEDCSHMPDGYVNCNDDQYGTWCDTSPYDPCGTVMLDVLPDGTVVVDAQGAESGLPAAPSIDAEGRLGACGLITKHNLSVVASRALRERTSLIDL